MPPSFPALRRPILRRSLSSCFRSSSASHTTSSFTSSSLPLLFPLSSSSVSFSPSSSSSVSLYISLRMKGSTSVEHSEVPLEGMKDKGVNLEEENGASSEKRSSAVPQTTTSISNGKQNIKDSAGHDAEQRREEKKKAFAASTLSTMEKAAYARREIFDLWEKVSEWEEERIALRYHRTSDANDISSNGLGNSTIKEGGEDKNVAKPEYEEGKGVRGKENEEEEEEATRRYDALQHLLHKYKLGIRTPLEEDVGRGLGDALDRLILMCVPLPPMRYGGGGGRGTQVKSLKQEKEGRDRNRGEEEKQDDENVGAGKGIDTEDPLGVLLQVLQIASRQGRRLSVRLVQHLFARTSNYTEALSVFHTLRRAHFAMNMETYHAMLYSLQRLEEEGWAKRFQEEYLQRQTSPTRGKESSSSSSGRGETADHELEAGGVSRQQTEESHEGLSEQALEFILRGVESPLLPENKPWIGQIMYGNGAGGREENEEEVLRSVKGGGIGATSTAAGRMRQTAKSWDELGELWVKRYKQR